MKKIGERPYMDTEHHRKTQNFLEIMSKLRSYDGKNGVVGYKIFRWGQNQDDFWVQWD